MHVYIAEAEAQQPAATTTAAGGGDATTFNKATDNAQIVPTISIGDEGNGGHDSSEPSSLLSPRGERRRTFNFLKRRDSGADSLGPPDLSGDKGGSNRASDGKGGSKSSSRGATKTQSSEKLASPADPRKTRKRGSTDATLISDKKKSSK